MRCNDCGAVHDGVARGLRGITLRRVNPQRVEAKGRVFGGNAVDLAKHLPWINGKLPIWNHLTFTHRHTVNADSVLVWTQIEVVSNMDRVD